MTDNIILKAENVSYKYPKASAYSVKNVSFSVSEGEILSIIGPNGAGKSTLLSLISGHKKPDEGKILLNDADIRKLSVLERAQNIAVIYQNEGISFPYTCLETVLMGLYPHNLRRSSFSDDDLMLAKSFMERYGVWQFADRVVDSLSGGELQRLLIARALMQNPKVLLLDEATADLDVSAKISISKLMREDIIKKHIAVISINHDLNLAYSTSDRILCLKDGKITADGSPKEIFTEKFLLENFGVKAKIFNEGFIITNNI